MRNQIVGPGLTSTLHLVHLTSSDQIGSATPFLSSDIMAKTAAKGDVPPLDIPLHVKYIQGLDEVRQLLWSCLADPRRRRTSRTTSRHTCA